MKKVLSLLLTVMLLFALAVPAMPLEFVPSVEGTEAPEVVAIADSEGNLYDAILEQNGEEIGVAEGAVYEMEVTPIAKSDEAPTEEIAAALELALEDILDAETVAELVPEIIAMLEGTDYKVEDFEIVDLFDVSLIEDGEPVEIPEGAILKFKFQTNLKEGEPFFLLHNYAPGKWEIVKNATVDANGVVSAYVDSLSPFAIVKLAEVEVEPIVDPSTGTIPSSPQTGDSFPALYLVCALLCAGAAVVLFKKAGKKA